MKINKNTSYIIGLAQTDGHLASSTRNRGKFSIELSEKDKDIIYKIAKLIKYNFTIFKRNRKTNFSNNFRGIGLRIYDKHFRAWLNKCGVPYGKKSEIIAPPLHIKGLSVADYVRGLWDGDGSVGFTHEKIPFMSFVTNSVFIRDFMEKYISEVIGNNHHHFNKPKRDNTYNIMIVKEDAVNLSKKIYTSGLSVKRKSKLAKKIKRWKRPSNMFKVTWERNKWTKEEDDFLMKNGIEKTMEKYQRSLSGIKIRLYRLEKNTTLHQNLSS